MIWLPVLAVTLPSGQLAARELRVCCLTGSYLAVTCVLFIWTIRASQQQSTKMSMSVRRVCVFYRWQQFFWDKSQVLPEIVLITPKRTLDWCSGHFCPSQKAKVNSLSTDRKANQNHFLSHPITLIIMIALFKYVVIVDFSRLIQTSVIKSGIDSFDDPFRLHRAKHKMVTLPSIANHSNTCLTLYFPLFAPTPWSYKHENHLSSKPAPGR